MSGAPDSHRSGPFRPGAVLALLAVGAAAFLLLLYALGKGWSGGEERDGGSHAAANGLNGYSGLVSLLEDTGHDVTLGRNPAERNGYDLLVLTPPGFSDPEEIGEIIQQRIDSGNGPTMLILPKWHAMPANQLPTAGAEGEAEDGWVVLAGAMPPAWFAQTGLGRGSELAIGRTRGWQGLKQSGDLPEEKQVQALVRQPEAPLRALVVDDEGDLLAGEIEHTGDDPYNNQRPWPVVVVIEPDLMNNYGMADQARARLALGLIDLASEGDTSLPITFDLTLNGLGASKNLLTLAFEPPFLAATLCLLLAALVIGWRAFRRFGPPVAEAAAMAQGKRQLARNGAALLQRVKRWHLLRQPYEDMIARRAAQHLGLRPAEHGAREVAIDLALTRRGHAGPPFSHLAGDLREARGPGEIIRAARRLWTFERTLTR